MYGVPLGISDEIWSARKTAHQNFGMRKNFAVIATARNQPIMSV